MSWKPVPAELTHKNLSTISKFLVWTSWSTPITTSGSSKSTPTPAWNSPAPCSALSSPKWWKTPSSTFALIQTHDGLHVPTSRQVQPQRRPLLQKLRTRKSVRTGLRRKNRRTLHCQRRRPGWQNALRRGWYLWRWGRGMEWGLSYIKNILIFFYLFLTVQVLNAKIYHFQLMLLFLVALMEVLASFVELNSS